MREDDRRPVDDATEVFSEADAGRSDAGLSEAELAEAATRVLPEHAAPFGRDRIPGDRGPAPFPGDAPGAAPARDAGEATAGEPDDDASGIATRVLAVEDETAPPPAAERARPTPAAAPAARVDASDRGLQPGTVLFGEYEIVSVLGAGGMGEVYRARHRRLDEHRAIKVMHAELSKRKGASEFFYREAKALLAVRHPAVVHCHDLLSDDTGRVFLIMEMIEGIPLSKKLNDGPLAPDDVAVLGARIAHGLAAAHRKGVIHRDLSPDNIVLPGGRVQDAKLIDFGIAKLLEQGEGTIVDGFKGKLTYASPEQLGFFGGRIDGRSDLYSLGLVLAAAALGRPMAMGTTVMEAVDARRGLASLPDAIPVGLRSAILPLLALDPDARPRHVDRLFVSPGAGDVGPDVDAYGVGSDGAGRTARRGPGASFRARPPRAGLFAGGAVAAAVVGLGAYVLLGPDEQRGGAPSLAETADPVAPMETSIEATDPSRAPAGATGPSAQAGATATATARPEAGAGGAVVLEAAGAKADDSPAGRASTGREVAAVEPRAARAPALRKSGPSAKDRVRIVGLLTGAKLALGEDHLMSPAGDNAFEKYRAVLALDPGNETARSGLGEIASRLVARAEQALDRGDTAAAREALRQARQADARFSGIRAAEQRLAGAGG
ncbi:MAG: protein kinase [Myxococcota bacterium]